MLNSSLKIVRMLNDSLALRDVMVLPGRVVPRWVGIYMGEVCSASRVSLAIVYHCDNRVIVSLEQ